MTSFASSGETQCRRRDPDSDRALRQRRERDRRAHGHSAPTRSPVGLALTAASVVVLPVLARAKLRLAGPLQSTALPGDGILNLAGAALAAVTLAISRSKRSAGGGPTPSPRSPSRASCSPQAGRRAAARAADPSLIAPPREPHAAQNQSAWGGPGTCYRLNTLSASHACEGPRLRRGGVTPGAIRLRPVSPPVGGALRPRGRASPCRRAGASLPGPRGCPSRRSPSGSVGRR
jgi:hypothetical protein